MLTAWGLKWGVARRGDILVARWRGRARRCYPIHSDRDPANEQEIAEPHAGQKISRNGAATRPLGEIACREKRAERRGASAVPVLGDLQGASVRIDSASVFTCLIIAFRITPESGATRIQ